MYVFSDDGREYLDPESCRWKGQSSLAALGVEHSKESTTISETKPSAVVSKGNLSHT